MRGEHRPSESQTTASTGSSPRARGAHLPGRRCMWGSGIIPACAGSTVRVTSTPASPGDHPRVRGEHAQGDLVARYRAGSSPRARGAPHGVRAQGHRHGIIPACAGSTNARPSPTSARWDHPRVRGEHFFGAPGVDPPPGIIPACAGSTRATSGVRRGRRDHPRVRGEHPENSIGARRRDHPRVRGEHAPEGGEERVLEGSSPRARGAPGLAEVARRPGGSSPRARGAREVGCERHGSPGIIPACAGSTCGGGDHGIGRRDHPRVRGEHAHCGTHA